MIHKTARKKPTDKIMPSTEPDSDMTRIITRQII